MKQAFLVEQLKALGEPNRLALAALVADGERGAGELLARLDLSQPSLSRHLKVLREAGVVRERRSGRNAYYRLADGELLHLVARLATEATETAEAGSARGRKGPDGQVGSRNINQETSVGSREADRPSEEPPARSSDFEEWLL